MRQIGKLMQEMGFKKEASEESQKAFFKYLIKAAQQTSSKSGLNLDSKDQEKTKLPEQLSFDLGSQKQKVS